MDKETLQKKIESGDTVWQLWKFANLTEIRQVKLEKKYKIVKDEYLVDDTEKILETISNLYATKEEAEWQLEFGNITRTEKLELPSWDEIDISNGDNVICIFNTKDGTECILSVNDFGDDDFYDWTIFLEKQGKECEDFDFTRYGYLEACRTCKKLFLGEGK